MPSLRQLRFLTALADTLNFSRAAEICHVTQPTLSTGLKELEGRLGVVLAERTRQSVMLTPAGKDIAARARIVLAGIKDIETAAQQRSGALQGEVHLGAIPTVGPFLLPRALPQIRRKWPDLRVFLREELTESLAAGLADGRLDVILAALPHDLGDAVVEPLFQDGYQLAVSTSHPLAAQGPASPEDLSQTPLLLLERGHCLQRHALSAFPGIDLRPDESFAATSLPTLVSMVEEGLGITLLPNLAVDAGVTQGHELALLPLPGTCPRQVVLAWRPGSPHSAIFLEMAALFRQVHAATQRM
ncbi:LysR family transcriptional regulator [Pannonibacter phragmitetus]|uniref:hydrogen peroxide-inducible genes activator n=1 Tax=Pannonibacter phragmitetus TaxID=121719 RepID=UPI00067DD005|nr:hydrogen peroxide-inducible genes activator [Pannonibacter phragmitetus]KND17949.1 LysR family transcriptional regulator [Pannonibacter phragmitetus]